MKHSCLTHNIVKELIKYDTETGLCFWNKRTSEWFNDGYHSAQHDCNKWNTRYAGKQIGMVCKNGYLSIAIMNKTFYLHRIIWFYMTGWWPEYIDHENGIRNDNRWCNLKNVTVGQNMKNRCLDSRNKSGRVGVIWLETKKRWFAQIRSNGIQYNLGYYKTYSEAVAAREAAEREHNFHPNHGRTVNV